MGWQDIPGRHAMGWILDEALPRTRRGGVWVEVGVALGKGIARMADVLERAERDDVQLFAVDPWAGYSRNGEQQSAGPASAHGDWKLFVDSMQKHAPEALGRVHILRASSIRAAKLFDPGEIDLCIIDADHTYPDVLADLTAWWPRIAQGGTIGGDDHHETEFPGVGVACREFFGSKGYEVRASEYDWPTWAMMRRTPAGGGR